MLQTCGRISAYGSGKSNIIANEKADACLLNLLHHLALNPEPSPLNSEVSHVQSLACVIRVPGTNSKVASGRIMSGSGEGIGDWMLWFGCSMSARVALQQQQWWWWIQQPRSRGSAAVVVLVQAPTTRPRGGVRCGYSSKPPDFSVSMLQWLRFGLRKCIWFTRFLSEQVDYDPFEDFFGLGIDMKTRYCLYISETNETPLF